MRIARTPRRRTRSINRHHRETGSDSDSWRWLHGDDGRLPIAARSGSVRSRWEQPLARDRRLQRGEDKTSHRRLSGSTRPNVGRRHRSQVREAAGPHTQAAAARCGVEPSVSQATQPGAQVLGEGESRGMKVRALSGRDDRSSTRSSLPSARDEHRRARIPDLDASRGRCSGPSRGDSISSVTSG